MIRITLLILATLFLNGCVNKHGISAKVYSDCKEYYDLQGFYHKDCDDGGMTTYEEMGEAFEEDPKAPEGNVW